MMKTRGAEARFGRQIAWRYTRRGAHPDFSALMRLCATRKDQVHGIGTGLTDTGAKFTNSAQPGLEASTAA